MKESIDPKQDLITNHLYEGEIPSIVGKHLLIVKTKGKTFQLFAKQASIPALMVKYGDDFVRDAGVIKTDTRPIIRRRRFVMDLGDIAGADLEGMNSEILEIIEEI